MTKLHLDGPAKMSNSTKGAAGELVVAADLMAMGWDVYRALSPAAPCDLVILRKGRVLRIEVRTGYRVADGSVRAVEQPQDAGRYDVKAIIVDGDISYVGPGLGTRLTDDAAGTIEVSPDTLKSWENRLSRIRTKVTVGDHYRAVAALTELKDEIAATRKGVS